MKTMMKFGLAALVLMAAGEAQAAGYGVTVNSRQATGNIYDRGAASCGYGNSFGDGSCYHNNATSSATITAAGGSGANADATKVTATMSAGGAGSTAQGRTIVDLSTGSIHLFGSDDAITGNCSYIQPCGGTNNYGTYFDTLHFTVDGAGADTVTPISLIFTLEGKMLNSGVAIDDSASGEIYGAMVFGNSDARFDLKSNSATGYATQVNYLDTYPSAYPGVWMTNADHTLNIYTETYNLIGASSDIRVSLEATLQCQNGYVCDFGDTAKLALFVPTGARFTSDSGVFLAGGRNTGSVPEPATWALMIMGMGLAGSALRRRPALAA